MATYNDLIIRKNNLLTKIDQIQFNEQQLTKSFWSWQLAGYCGLLTYFGLQLLFLKSNYTQIQTTNPIAQFIYTVTVLPFTSGSVQNPILNRGINSGGHELAYISLTTLCIVSRYCMPKNIRGFYYSLLIPAFAVSVSEGAFDIWYYYMYYYLWPHVTWDIFILTNPLAIFYIFSFMTGVFLTPVWKYLDKKFFIVSMIAIQVYFIVWVLIGLPVTLSSLLWKIAGNLDTQFYDSLYVNSLEIFQWVIASFSMSLAVIALWITKQKIKSL